MSARRKKNSLIRDIGGIALADILANGVVVLLVVIIITISFKKQQTEHQIEQNVKISAILARDIASSLVFNDLPSSPPAILHNYLCQSPHGPWRNYYEQHDCMPWLYPIIEFRKGYLREANSRRIFTRAKLLDESNAFDAYLLSLSSIERERIRMDIYDIDIYYLGLSILKEHNLRPSHWHFWGEDESTPKERDIQNFVGESAEDLDDSSLTLEENGEGEGQETEGEGIFGIEQERIPADVSLRSPRLAEEMLPPSDSLSRLGGRPSPQETQEEGSLSYGDSIAEALVEALSDEEEASSDVFGAPSRLKLRIPGMESAQPLRIPPELFGSFQGEPVDYHLFMITMLLDYLTAVEKMGFDRVAMDDLIARLLRQDIAAHPYIDFARMLKERMRVAFENRDGDLRIEKRECRRCQTELHILPNNPTNEAILHSLMDMHIEETPYINVEMRLYPYPQRGQFTEIYKGDTILIHPQSVTRGGKKWYAAAIIDPNIEDVVIGYVYIDDAYAMFGVQADVNSLRFGDSRLFTSLPAFPLREEMILGIVYGGLTLLIITVFFFLLNAFFFRPVHAKK